MVPHGSGLVRPSTFYTLSTHDNAGACAIWAEHPMLNVILINLLRRSLGRQVQGPTAIHAKLSPLRGKGITMFAKLSLDLFSTMGTFHGSSCLLSLLVLEKILFSILTSYPLLKSTKLLS